MPAPSTVEDVHRLDLRIARILTADCIPGADHLLRLTVDAGDGTRQVIAGIRSGYPPESLIGRLTVIVANLPAKKMRFGTSEGMVLAASAIDGTSGPFLLGVDEGALPGMQVR